MSALIAVGCGAFAADVGVKVNMTFANGQVKMTVEVDESTDLKVWKPAKKVDLVDPVEGEKGFYILKSK